VNAQTAPPVVLQRTVLHAYHQAAGAHFVPFAGWEMPLYYSGILEEHRAVRSRVGWFDVSHMGLLVVAGASAPALLSRRTTANIARLSPGQCRYTFWLDSDGKILDDLLITRLDPGTEGVPSYLVVPNAARADRIVELLRQQRKPDLSVTRLNGEAALIAVQGPASRELLDRATGWRLERIPFYQARRLPAHPRPEEPSEPEVGIALPADLRHATLVSRTGYTGELGYELLVEAAQAGPLVERLTALGAMRCGLGARDTLRLEKGYLLSGQDFSRDRTPFEAGQDRFVELDHPFVGREALEKQKADGLPARLTGLAVTQPGAIPRHGTPVLSGGNLVTHLTSGGLSPMLGIGIALAYLPMEMARAPAALELDIRGSRVPAEVRKLPFYPAPAPNAS
jgi:glycine cleavage system T protein (aminomethyltransferase)